MVFQALRFVTAGESHGPGLTCIVEGLPANLQVTQQEIDNDLARRQLGHGRGGRMKIESDRVEVTAGLRHGKTLGGPVALQVKNRDYENWQERMNPWPVDAVVEKAQLPRPGHADLAGSWKYGFDDVRNVLERASARETAARVAGGALAKVFLASLGVQVRSHTVQVGNVKAQNSFPKNPEAFVHVDENPVRCLDQAVSEAMVEHITQERKKNESIGGVFEVIVYGCVPGLGSHVSFDERLDGRLAGAICSIQAVKGVEFGDGFQLAQTPGSQAHDEIFYQQETGFYRQSNHSGGLEGGMTIGQPLVMRGALKPIPTLTQPLRSVDLETHQPAQAMRERTDSCVVPAAGVVAEAMVAFVIADAYRRKFGGDSIEDTHQAVHAYCKRIGWPAK